MNTRPIFGLWAIVVGLALCAIGISLSFRPTEYQAAVKVRIELESSDIGPPDPHYVSGDPYFIETEFVAISSEAVLSNVVETLDLNTEWGKRYGRTLETAETIKFLKPQIDISAEQNTTIIEIRVTDEDPNEAAQIANAIAKSYRDYRIAQRERLSAAGIKLLEEDFQKEEARIKAMQAHLEELQKQLNLTNNESDDVLRARYPEYYKAKQSLDSETITGDLLKAKIEADEADSSIPKWIPVAIIDPAVPPTAPCGPSRTLGMALFICGLAMAGFGFYSVRNTGIRGQIKSNAV